MMNNDTDATASQISDARDWAADCMGMGAGRTPSAERAVAYVKAEYPGGWDAFVAECGDEEAPAETRQVPESYGTIWVCQDCMLHHANGECGGCHDDEHGHDEEPLSAIGDDFHVAMGLAWDEHAEGCHNRAEREWRGECDCETNTYSTSQCEGCRSYLHGERHAMTLFKGV